MKTAGRHLRFLSLSSAFFHIHFEVSTISLIKCFPWHIIHSVNSAVGIWVLLCNVDLLNITKQGIDFVLTSVSRSTSRAHKLCVIQSDCNVSDYYLMKPFLCMDTGFFLFYFFATLVTFRVWKWIENRSSFVSAIPSSARWCFSFSK